MRRRWTGGSGITGQGISGFFCFTEARGVQSQVIGATRLLLMEIREGNEEAKRKCQKSLAIVMRSWRMRLEPASLTRECAYAMKWT